MVSWVGKWKGSIESRREMGKEEMEEAGRNGEFQRTFFVKWMENKRNVQGRLGRRVEGIKEKIRKRGGKGIMKHLEKAREGGEWMEDSYK